MASQTFTLWHQARDYHLANPTTNIPSAECTICYSDLRILLPPGTEPDPESVPAVLYPCGHMTCASCWISLARSYQRQRRGEDVDGVKNLRCSFCKLSMLYTTPRPGRKGGCDCHAMPLPLPEHSSPSFLPNLITKLPLTTPEGGKPLGRCSSHNMDMKHRIREIRRFLKTASPNSYGRIDFSSLADALSPFMATDSRTAVPLVEWLQMGQSVEALVRVLGNITGMYMEGRHDERMWGACAEGCARAFASAGRERTREMYVGVKELFGERRR
ncbi:hypothetical protein OQA88_10689 [Cercophora sp. LCS_1]